MRLKEIRRCDVRGWRETRMVEDDPYPAPAVAPFSDIADALKDTSVSNSLLAGDELVLGPLLRIRDQGLYVKLWTKPDATLGHTEWWQALDPNDAATTLALASSPGRIEDSDNLAADVSSLKKRIDDLTDELMPEKLRKEAEEIQTPQFKALVAAWKLERLNSDPLPTDSSDDDDDSNVS